MDQRDLGVARYDAGAEYLDALRRLKLEPEALFWAYDPTLGQFVLVIVTSLFDFAGPLALTKLLFDAYNASATPSEIDPFILRLHSPKHALYRAAQFHIGNRFDMADLKARIRKGAHWTGPRLPARSRRLWLCLFGQATWRVSEPGPTRALQFLQRPRLPTPSDAGAASRAPFMRSRHSLPAPARVPHSPRRGNWESRRSTKRSGSGARARVGACPHRLLSSRNKGIASSQARLSPVRWS